MNCRQAFVVAFAMLATLPLAIAQAPAPEASPAASPGALSQDGARPPARVNRDAAADVHADARLCLEFTTNLEVIACAEKYRPHKRNG